MAQSATTFESHQLWLANLYAEHARLSGRDESEASPSAAAPAALPSPPMVWAHPEEANNIEHSFAGINLDYDDFDAPVYRSLGSALFSSGSGDSVFAAEEPDEMPVYRGLNLAAAFAEAEPAPEAQQDPREQWLATMPPLIQRQKAGLLQ